MLTNQEEYADINKVGTRVIRRDSSTRSLVLSNKSLYSPVGKTEKDEEEDQLSPLLSLTGERWLNPVISLHSKIP